MSISEGSNTDTGLSRFHLGARGSVALAVLALLVMFVSVLVVSTLSMQKSKSARTTKAQTWHLLPDAVVEVEPVEYIEAIDGDTVALRFKDGSVSKVRMIGIDAPEASINSDRYTVGSQAFAQELIEKHTQLYVELGVNTTDRYGQTLAYIWLEPPSRRPLEPEVREKMLNARMVISGFAKEFQAVPGVAYANDRYSLLFKKYAVEARAQKSGFWSDEFNEEVGPSERWSSSAPSGAQTAEFLYVGNATSRKFHVVACENAQEMRVENRIPIDTREEAIASGFLACGVCSP